MLNERPFYHPFKRAFRTGVAILLPVALAVVSSVAGVAGKEEPPWVAKDWRQWTASDCKQVLSSSNWIAEEQQEMWSFYGFLDIWQRGISTPVRLLSALPIRQALLRQIQIQNHYDKMNPQEKRAFDHEHAQELSEDNGGQVLIWTSGGMHSFPNGSVTQSYPARQAALRLSDGSLVMPVRTTLSGEVTDYEIISGVRIGHPAASIAEYVFSRTVNGKPLYGEQDEAITVVFGDILPYKGKTEELGPQRPEYFHPYKNLRVDFPISALMYKGKLEY